MLSEESVFINYLILSKEQNDKERMGHRRKEVNYEYSSENFNFHCSNLHYVWLWKL